MDYVLEMFDSMGDGLDSFTRELGVHKSPGRFTKEVTAYQYDLVLAMIGIIVTFLLLVMVIFCLYIMNRRRNQADQTPIRKSSFDYINFRKHANLV